jgi:hypothetical protein
MQMDTTMSLDEKYAFIKIHYGESIHGGTVELFKEISYSQVMKISKNLVAYSNILCPVLLSSGRKDLTYCLKLVAIDLSQRLAKPTAYSNFISLKTHIIKLIERGDITWVPYSTEHLSFLSVAIPKMTYEELKKQAIPRKIQLGFKHVNPKIGVFKEVLNKTCSPEISGALINHAMAYKKKTKQRIIAQLTDFLNGITTDKPDWYNHPLVLQSELIKFRANLLDRYQRNTAYLHFHIISKAIRTLMEQGLLDSQIDLPDNYKGSWRDQTLHANNPLVSSLDLYDLKSISSNKDTPRFLELLKKEIHTNLACLTDVAKDIVWKGYQDYLLGSEVVTQYKNFIVQHTDKNIDIEAELAPKFQAKLSAIWPENNISDFLTSKRVAYYDSNYEFYIAGGTNDPNSPYKVSNSVNRYLGLTIEVASAMQTIIVEEIGINPFSLYDISISSDGVGREFVQITDEGSVRLRALKKRAKQSKTRKAKGGPVLLSQIQKSDIDAATCLKMALEMTSRARNSSEIRKLWIIRTANGVQHVSDTAFQHNFNKMKASLPSENNALQHSTLKKIRGSKGVLIFLQSRGDALRTANYLGNKVETTLNRYIPPYLSELIYRNKIRAFQNILLYMAIGLEDSPSDALNMSEEELKSQLEVAFNNEDMGGNLYDKLKNPNDENTQNKEVYFCVSIDNIKTALIYIKTGSDPILKEQCVNAVSAISESTVIMKQMLRTAQLAVQKSEVK